MAWLAVNKDGTEWIMPEKPVRGWCGHWEYFGRSVYRERTRKRINRDRTPQRVCLQTTRQGADMG